MKAIILAAGVGKRLASTKDRPKCLIRLNGKTILDRYFESFEQLGITGAVILVGHMKDKIVEEIGPEKNGIPVTYIDNEKYREGNIYTVHLASSEFDDDILMMDADVVYHPELLRRLVKSPNPSSYLMDEGFIEENGEECKVAALGGRVVANNRVITAEYDRIGEGLGFLKLSKPTAGVFRQIVQSFIDAGKVGNEYEDALEELLGREAVGFEPTDGLPWCEIDFDEDVEKAQEIVNRLETE